MAVSTIGDVKTLADRAAAALTTFTELANRLDNSIAPPYPVPLTLMGFEAWLESARVALRKPRVAQSRRLLLNAGIDPNQIPVEVLSDPIRITAILAKLGSAPVEMRPRMTTATARALANGLDEADAIAEAFAGLADALKSIAHVKESCPAIYSLLLGSAPDAPKEHTAFLTRVRRTSDLLEDAGRQGITLAFGSGTLEDAQRVLERFGGAAKDLRQVLLTEGLAQGEWPALQGLTLDSAAEACEQRTASIREEKARLTAERDMLGRTLRMMGAPSGDLSNTVADLRRAVSESRMLLKNLMDTLRGRLGAETVLVIDALVQGRLPTNDELGDTKLGAALRKAAAAGFRIKMEAPSED